MTPPDGRFAAGFMDDYFAEADEHIVAVRSGLLTLEAPPEGVVPAGLVDELFRRIHSLKGISAMVELREAEIIAHHLESCLREIRHGHLQADARTVEVLASGAKLLEDVITAVRDGSPVPAIDAVAEHLEALSGARAGGDGRGGETFGVASGPAPTRAGGRRWGVTFIPSPALVARGVKVDTVRSRLASIGEILGVTPRVLAGGGVAFEFVIRTDHEAQLREWSADGLTCEPIIDEAPATTDAAPVAVATERRAETGREAAPHGAHLVRVDLARLDDLMRLVGDMVVTRARLEDTLGRVERHVPFQDWRSLQDHSAGLERQLRDLREAVMRVRLVPVGDIFRRMPFVVRDLARDSAKRVELELVGQSTEIDKFLIERMMDPILHLVRNAISHAIELPDARAAAGKPPHGTIRLAAWTAGESVVLEVGDDGQGIDAEAVAARARARGLRVSEGPLDGRALLDILTTAGFSTRDEADRASGRGVGMSVVRGTVEELGGTLAVDTTPGRGTTFRITLPLTLAITDAVIAHVGSQTFAIPQSVVREVIEVDMAFIRTMPRNELVTYRGGTLPIVRVNQLFGMPASDRPRHHAIVVGDGPAAVGLLVERISGQREIVVKSISDPLIRVTGVSGATELGDGRVVLILDAPALSRMRPHPPSPTAHGVPA